VCQSELSVGHPGQCHLFFVGRTPWSAADALVWLLAPAADQGVRPNQIAACYRQLEKQLAWLLHTRSLVNTNGQ